MNSIHDFEQGNCPNCGVSWQGEEIPEKDRQMFGGSTNFSRVIGVEYSCPYPEAAYDGISEYRCPDCEARFGRWTGNQLKDGEAEPRFGGKRVE